MIGDSADRRVEILSDHQALNATWSRFGPRREGADLHVHRRHTDLFYVLEGELTVMLGPAGEGVVVPAGTLARVPPLVVHGFRNASDAELRYVNLHAPGVGFADYMRAMRDGRRLSYDQEPPPPDGGRSAAEAVVGGDELLAERVVLLVDVEEIGISKSCSDPSGPSPPPHVHRRHAESFYVLEGELAITVGDRQLRAEAGSWVQVPPGVPHTVSHRGSEPACFLDLHAPNCGFGAFLRALHAAGDDEQRAVARAGFDQQPRDSLMHWIPMPWDPMYEDRSAEGPSRPRAPLVPARGTCARVPDQPASPGAERRRVRASRRHALPGPSPPGGGRCRSSRWSSESGRRRRVYRLTRRGSAALASRETEWRQFTSTVDLVLGGAS